MSVKVGTTDIATVGKVKLGTTNITKVYRGSTKIWPAVVAYSFNTAGISGGSSSGVCNVNFDTMLDFTLYSDVQYPAIGNGTMYTDPLLENKFNGGDQWYKVNVLGTIMSYSITTTGGINDSSPCP